MRFFSSLAIVLALMATMIVTSSQAMASAIGCDNRQTPGDDVDPNAIAVDIKEPYGYLCHSVHTNGKEIKEQRAAFTTHAGINEPRVKNICNWRIDFVYFDTEGDEYSRDKGETIGDCKKGASREIAKAVNLPDYGTTCANLFVDGELRYTQCHRINAIE